MHSNKQKRHFNDDNFNEKTFLLWKEKFNFEKKKL